MEGRKDMEDSNFNSIISKDVGSSEDTVVASSTNNDYDYDESPKFLRRPSSLLSESSSRNSVGPSAVSSPASLVLGKNSPNIINVHAQLGSIQEQAPSTPSTIDEASVRGFGAKSGGSSESGTGMMDINDDDNNDDNDDDNDDEYDNNITNTNTSTSLSAGHTNGSDRSRSINGANGSYGQYGSSGPYNSHGSYGPNGPYGPYSGNIGNGAGHHLRQGFANNSSLPQSRNNSIVSPAAGSGDYMLSLKRERSPRVDNNTSLRATTSSSERPEFNNNDSVRSIPTYQTVSKVKETHHVYVEYDPVSRRKVLNTYEILKNLGKGQHGKVKLAKDMLSDRLVAIKIVDRKTKPKLGKLAVPGSTQEDKIKREIAIMKKCDHPHVVKLIEVLDDVKSRKIYLVLEYLEKGEIRWQEYDETIGDFKPVLKFHEAKKIFRDVVLGLEYLHYQGIIHRDIKPANLLVSADDVVKISDFGVSFASSLDDNNFNNELELCKTAGTPAFLAPELCQTENFTNFLENSKKITHKIDIWALGVTLFCLLFGKLPFNSDTEFGLFEAINNDSLKIPPKSSVPGYESVSDNDFESAKDLLSKLLIKDQDLRIDIPQIKKMDFFLEGLSRKDSKKYTTENVVKIDISNEEVDDAVIGIGNKIKKKLANAFKFGFRNSNNSYSNSNNSVNSSDSDRSLNHQLNSISIGTADGVGVTAKNIVPNNSNDSSNNTLILSESLRSTAASPSAEFQQQQQRHHLLSLSAAMSAANNSNVINNNQNGRHHSRNLSSGSAGLVETRKSAQGSFNTDSKQTSASNALTGIIKKNDDMRESISDSLTPSGDALSNSDDNSFIVDNIKSHQNSTDIGSLGSCDPSLAFSSLNKAKVNIPSNTSFASLGSFDDHEVIDFSNFVPLKYKSSIKDNESKNQNDIDPKAKTSDNDEIADIDITDGPDFIYADENNNNNHAKKQEVRRSSQFSYSSYSTCSSSSSSSSETVSKYKDKGNRSTSKSDKSFFELEDSEGDESSDEKNLKENPISATNTDSNFSSTGDEAEIEDEEEEDDDAELTFAFGPKRDLPLFKPQISKRVKSYESNIPTIRSLAHAKANNDVDDEDDKNFIITNSSSTVSFDLPLEFQQKIPELSSGSSASGSNMRSIARANSNLNITTNNGNRDGTQTMLEEKGPLSTKASSLLQSSQSVETIQLNNNSIKFLESGVSPTIKSLPKVLKSDVSSHLVLGKDVLEYDPRLFQNHYNKDRAMIPFQKAVHYNEGEDKQKNSGVLDKHNKNNINKKGAHRSNSITIGLLKHNSSSTNSTNK